MRVLVTGGSGRLGRVVVPRLVEQRYPVRVASRRPHPDRVGVEWVVADLATGAGVVDAVTSVDVVVHLASAPYRGRYTVRVDVEGTRRLASAAYHAGVAHLVYTGIVGQDQVPWPYFRRKTAAEEAVRASGVGWSVVRATQFHELVDAVLTAAARLPVLVTDPGIPAQPVDTRDVADRLLSRIADGPSGRVENFGGPEVLQGAEPLHQWLQARGIRKRVWNVRLPGRLGRAFRAGHLVTDADPRGRISWREYLRETYGPPLADRPGR